MAKIIFIFFIFSLTVFGQENKNSEEKFITFSYNENDYKKIANDTIKKMYYNQKDMNSKTDVFNKNSISELFEFDNISISVIPKFRLKRDANKLFTCESSIENFIAFDEINKFMTAVLEVNNKYKSMPIIPHPYFETERINNPDWTLKVDKDSYQTILRVFVAQEDYLKKIQKDLDKRKGNFLFGIYGLWDVIFEIDSESGILFANKYGYEDPIRLPANEYIRKYEGQLKIREIARGYYEDIDGLGTLDPIPCEGNITSSEIIRLKVLK